MRQPVMARRAKRKKEEGILRKGRSKNKDDEYYRWWERVRKGRKDERLGWKGREGEGKARGW
jgi:hypothetical protein